MHDVSGESFSWRLEKQAEDEPDSLRMSM